MHEHNVARCTPRVSEADKDMPLHRMIEDFSPGYMERGMHLFPKQSDRDPWRNTQNYTLDKQTIRNAPIDDGTLEFANTVESAESEKLPSTPKPEVKTAA